MKSSPPPNPKPSAELRQRILRQARTDFFAHGYSRLTMDALARELGLSKKTLYVHFAGKDQIVAALIDDFAAEIRRDADALLNHRELNLAEKLRGFVEGMIERMARLTPHTLRDLQRFAPRLYAKLEEMRAKTLPYVFGRFIEEGQAAGLVRPELPPGFALDFFLHAMHGLLQPATLERHGRHPRDVIPQAIDLFFGGLLTTPGRKQYEKLFPR